MKNNDLGFWLTISSAFLLLFFVSNYFMFKHINSIDNANTIDTGETDIRVLDQEFYKSRLDHCADLCCEAYYEVKGKDCYCYYKDHLKRFIIK